jgi:TP901 family phage tail tape measure protein
MGLELQFSADKAREQLKKLKQDLSKTGKNISETTEDLKNLGKSVSALEKSFKKSGNKEAAESFSKINTEIKETIGSIRNIKKEVSDTSRETVKYKKSNDSLTRSLEVAKKQLEGTKLKLDETKKVNFKYLDSNKKLNSEIVNLKRTIRDLGKDLKLSEKELLKTYGVNYKLIDSVDKLSVRNKELGNTNRSLSGRLSSSRQQVTLLQKEIKNLHVQVLKLGKQNLELQKKVSGLSHSLNKSQKEVKQSKKVIAAYDAQLSKAWNTMDRYEKKIDSQRRTIERMTKANKKASYSINAIMKAASTVRNLLFLSTMAYGVQRLSNAIIKLGADFEKTMTMVGAVTQNIGKGFETKGYDDLIKKALELGEATEYSSNQAAEAMKNLGLAGFNTKQIIATVPGVLDLATAGQVDLATASKLAVQALTAMGLKTADTSQLMQNMTRVNDAFISTTIRTNTTIESLAEAFKYVAQPARNTGMQIEELANLLGLLGNSGVEASMSGTQLAFALTKQNKAMKALGLNPEIATFRDMLKEINEQGWGFNDIYDIFIQRGSRAVLALKDMIPVWDRLDELQKESGLSAKELADIYRDTVSIQLQRLKSLIENIGISGFRRQSDELKDSLKNLYDIISKNKDNLEKIAAAFVKLTSVLVDLTAKTIEFLPRIKAFYEDNKGQLEALATAAGSILILTGNIKSGLSLIGLAYGSFNIELSDQTSIDNLNFKLENLRENLKELEKSKNSYRVIQGYFGSPSVTISNKDQIDYIKKQISTYEDELVKLIDKQSKTQENSAKKLFINRSKIIKDLAVQYAQDIKQYTDIEKSAAKELRESQDKLDEILGSASNKLKMGRNEKLTFIGSMTLELQKEKAVEQIDQKYKELNEVIEKRQKDLNKLLKERDSAYSDLLSFSAFKNKDESFEGFQIIQTRYDTAKAAVEKTKKAVEDLIKTLNITEDQKKALSEKFAFQIEEREFNRQQQVNQKILDSENKLFDIRESNYENFEKYKAQTSLKFIKENLNNQIKAEKQAYNIFINQQKFIPPEQRMTTEELSNFKKIMEEYFKELEKNKTRTIEKSSFETFDIEMKNQEDLQSNIRDMELDTLDMKKNLVTGFGYFRIQKEKEILAEEIKLRIAAEKQKVAQEGRRKEFEVFNGLISEDEYESWATNASDYLKTFSEYQIKLLNDLMRVSWDSILSGIESATENVIGNIFSDALKGDLQNASDYFQSFTDSLSSMWSQMAANMILNGTTLAGLTGLQTVGVMGAAGLVLGGISQVFSSREKRKAERARKAALRDQLKDELGDALASLKLSDTGYEIYKLNKRIEDLTEQAKDAGYPMEEIIELRKLETKAILDEVAAKYKTINTNITDWITGIEREDWGVDEWKAEYDRLHDDLLSLDHSSTTYQDDSISKLEDMFDALQNIYEIQKEQLQALDSLDQSLTSQIWNLQNTGAMPTSLEAYRTQYDALLAATRDSEGNIVTEAVSDFQDFISSYQDVFSAAGFDVNEILYGSDRLPSIIGDLTGVQEDVKSEMEILTEAINLNSGKLGETGTSLGNVKESIDNLYNLTKSIANKEAYEVWKTLIPQQPSMSSDLSNYFEGYLGSHYDASQNMYIGNNQNMIDAWISSGAGGQVLGYMSGIQANFDWINSIDKNISPEISKWVDDINNIGLTVLTKDNLFDLADLDSNNIITYSEWASYIKDFFDKYNVLMSYINNPPDISSFAKGGWSNEPSIFGETGYGEYAVPDANNPNNSHFLKSVGIDSTKIGIAIGEIVASRLSGEISSNSNNQNGDIVIQINGKEIARATIQEIRRDKSLKKYI